MAVASERQVTLEEFLALPEEEPPFEYADGVITQKVSPQAQHGALQAQLAMLLGQACQAAGTARVFTEARATFAGASLVPDISVYRRERIPVDSQGRMLQRLTSPPDIAIEIVSPGQSVTGLVRKCLRYVSSGVQIALLVDPDDQSVLVFRPDQPDMAWRGTDAVDLSAILPELQLTVQELFAALQIS